MNQRGKIIQDISQLIELFRLNCSETETLDWLGMAALDKEQWPKAHGVFGQIRNKTIKAGRKGNSVLEAQYLFEEVCAKTLHNLSGQGAPFDADSPYWIIPNALALARQMGMSETDVLACLK